MQAKNILLPVGLLCLMLAYFAIIVRPAQRSGKDAFIQVYLTDGDSPRFVRWAEVTLVEDGREVHPQEPYFILSLSDGQSLTIKTPYSFAAIEDRLRDRER